jgi:hypothetical protein
MTFTELIQTMVDADLALIQAGERMPDVTEMTTLRR